jgi:hypothetical protein
MKKVKQHHLHIKNMSEDMLRGMKYFDGGFTIDSMNERTILVHNLTEQFIRAELRLCPWYLFYRKAFLNLVVVYALEQRILFLMHTKQRTN